MKVTDDTDLLVGEYVLGTLEFDDGHGGRNIEGAPRNAPAVGAVTVSRRTDCAGNGIPNRAAKTSAG